MNSVDTEHILRELKDNLRKKDVIKADIVLSYLEDTESRTREKAFALLESADPEFFFDLVRHMEKGNPDILSTHPEIHKILSTQALKSPGALCARINAPEGPSPSLIRTAGETDLPQAVPVLKEILESNPDPATARDTLQALGAVADPGSVNSISRYLYAADNRTISEAIRALAEIGTPTAMRRLAESMGGNHQTDLLILDLFSRIQDDTAITKLSETLSSHYAHLRGYAKAKLAGIGKKAVPFLTRNLLHEDPDLRIHSLNLLGEIQDSSAYPAIRKLLNEQPKDPNVRFAAYETLGTIFARGGAHTLANGLLDPEEQVRLAAAGAIENNLNGLLSAGIANMLELGEKERKNICAAIINSRARKLFTALLSNQDFRAVAIRRLKNDSPRDLRTYFAAILDKNGYEEEAAELLREETEKGKRPLALAVDDSDMILNIYKNALYGLGYEPVLFNRPEKALKWLHKNRPRVMFTDLNMPEMTGVELIQKTRKLHPRIELPVIMITTQNEIQDNQDAIRAGATRVGRKPFSAHSLREILQGVGEAAGSQDGRQ
ncbi:MAG: HEAT repeat domain-containing protein [Desulfonatronovibrionaceae bacterium]